MNSQDLVLITTCTHRKRGVISEHLQASALKSGPQESVLKEWCSRIIDAAKPRVASMVYCGRGFKEALAASSTTAKNLFIISAGLGLISHDTMIAPYNLTISRSSSDSLSKKITDDFLPESWWTGLNTSLRGRKNPICELIKENPSSHFIIALSSAYFSLIRSDLLLLSDLELQRLAIVGLGLKRVLDDRLYKTLVPYDERLNRLVGANAGTRSDFAQRAMRHFVTEVLPKNNKELFKDQIPIVDSLLSSVVLEQAPKRERMSDDQIVGLMEKYQSTSLGSCSKLLRIMRDKEGIACEQSRFRRLFDRMKQKRE